MPADQFPPFTRFEHGEAALIGHRILCPSCRVPLDEDGNGHSELCSALLAHRRRNGMFNCGCSRTAPAGQEDTPVECKRDPGKWHLPEPAPTITPEG
jgi:hypothetical protein